MWQIHITKHLICLFSTIWSLLPVSRLLNWRFQSRVILSSLTQQAIQVLASVLLDFGIAQQPNGWWDCVTNTWTQWVVLQTRLGSSRAPLHQTHPAGQTARCTWRLLERRRQRLRWRTGLSPRCGTHQTRYIHPALGNNIISCESKHYCSYEIIQCRLMKFLIGSRIKKSAGLASLSAHAVSRLFRSPATGWGRGTAEFLHGGNERHTAGAKPTYEQVSILEPKEKWEWDPECFIAHKVFQKQVWILSKWCKYGVNIV